MEGHNVYNECNKVRRVIHYSLMITEKFTYNIILLLHACTDWHITSGLELKAIQYRNLLLPGDDVPVIIRQSTFINYRIWFP